jgi:hypothetical protein
MASWLCPDPAEGPAETLRRIEAERSRRRLRSDPVALMRAATGLEPDDWQARVLGSPAERMLLLTHRQAGKSTAVASLAIGTALHRPESLVLLVSRSQRQSGELFRKVTRFYKRLGSPIKAVEDNAITLALENGSRIVSLPNSPDTIVGFSAPQLIIIDEAARTSDETFHCTTPMLLRSRGRLVAMSTPYGKRGWFYEAWHDHKATWERVMFRASDNPRLDPDYLAEELQIQGPRWYGQEWECEFNETVDQIFSTEAIEGAFDSEEPLLF